MAYEFKRFQIAPSGVQSAFSTSQSASVKSASIDYNSFPQPVLSFAKEETPWLSISNNWNGSPVQPGLSLVSTDGPPTAKSPAEETLRLWNIDVASLGGEDPTEAVTRILLARGLRKPDTTSQRYLERVVTDPTGAAQLVRSNQIEDAKEQKAQGDLQATMSLNGVSPSAIANSSNTLEEQAAYRMGIQNWRGITAANLQKETAKLQGVTQAQLDRDPTSGTLQSNLTEALNFLQAQGINTRGGTYADMVRGYALYYGLPNPDTATWADVFERWRNAENGGAPLVTAGRLPAFQDQPLWNQLRTEKGEALRLPEGVSVPAAPATTPATSYRPPGTLPVSTGARPKILVIDQFTFQNGNPTDLKTRRGIDVDGDNIPDIPHGDGVSAYILAELPEADIIRQDLNGMSSTTVPTLFSRIADTIRAERAAGRRSLEAVNLSQTTSDGTGQLTTVQDLGKVLGITGLTPENIREKRQEVKDRFATVHALRNSGNETALNQYLTDRGITLAMLDGYLSWWPAIQALERISKEQNVPVYLGAGNEATRTDGQNPINLFSLAEGTIPVGALDSEGRPVTAYTNNSLITERARGIYPVRMTPSGMDITADGRADVATRWLSGGGGPLTKAVSVNGTSYAAPTLLAKQVAERTRRAKPGL